MSVDHFCCFLWVKILWDINLNHFFFHFSICVCVVCVCVCVQTYSHKISVCTCALAYMDLFPKMVAEEDTLFFLY